MFSRATFGTEPPLADSDHMVGAMVITVAVIALAEVARPLRSLNAVFGIWLLASPWLLSGGAGAAATWNSIIVGFLLTGLSLPLGRRSSEHSGFGCRTEDRMGIYRRSILPRLIDWTMQAQDLAAYRERLASGARGVVLEVGIGSGLNLPFYGPEVERVIGIDPSAELLARSWALVAPAKRPVHLVRAAAEAIPLRQKSVDTIVMAWTLCSMTDARSSCGISRPSCRSSRSGA